MASLHETQHVSNIFLHTEGTELHLDKEDPNQQVHVNQCLLLKCIVWGTLERSEPTVMSTCNKCHGYPRPSQKILTPPWKAAVTASSATWQNEGSPAFFQREELMVSTPLFTIPWNHAEHRESRHPRGSVSWRTLPFLIASDSFRSTNSIDLPPASHWVQ